VRSHDLYGVGQAPHHWDSGGAGVSTYRRYIRPLFRYPFTIGLDDRYKCLLHGFHGLPNSVRYDEPAYELS